MANRRVGGIIFFKIDGELFQAMGEFTVNLGVPKREAVVGPAVTHGFSETAQSPSLEGAIIDSDELNLEAFLNVRDATITLELANGKVIVYREAFYAGDGNVTTEKGQIEVMFKAISAEEIL